MIALYFSRFSRYYALNNLIYILKVPIIRYFFILFLFIPFFTTYANKLVIESISSQIDRESQITTYLKPRVLVQGHEISAEKLQYDIKKKTLFLEGGLLFHSKNSLISGQSLFYDIKNKTAIFKNANLYDQEGSLYIRAKEIRKNGEKQYLLLSGEITKCSPLTPGWELKFKSLEYNEGGLVHAKQVSFYFHSVPVFYQPYLVFNARTERSSGFLAPIYSFNSGAPSDNEEINFNLGHRLRLPFFLNLAQDHDLTLTPDIIQKRGLGLGLEYNYAFSEEMSGQLYTWGLPEIMDSRDQPSSISDSDYTPKPFRYKYEWSHQQGIFFDGSLYSRILENGDSIVNREFFDSDIESNEDYQFQSL